MKNIVAPGSYDLLNNEFNTSLPTGIMLESYLNFGIWGVVFLGFIYGYCSKKLMNSLFFKNNTPKSDILLFFTAYLLVTAISFGEFLGAFTRVAIFIVPFILFKSKKYNEQ